MRWSLGCMHIVAGSASATLFLIHMHPVKIQIAITKLRQSRARCILDEVAQVAAKAKLISLHLKRGVELSGIFQEQQAEVIGAMRLMTRGARPISNWSVVIGIVLQQRSHIGQRTAGRGCDRLVMAREAKVRLRGFLQIGQAGEVWIVAADAAAGLGDWTVLDRSGANEVLHTFMAGVAQIRAVRDELILHIRSMGVVAGRAAILHRFVLMPCGDARWGCLCMTFDAQIFRTLG